MGENPFLIALAAIIALYLALALRKHPRAALVVWLGCTILVPVWLEVRIGASLQPLSLLAVCLLPSVLHHWRGKLRAGDWVMVGFAAAGTLGFLFFGSPTFAWAAIFTQWIAAYLVGRSLAPAAGTTWTTQAIAVTGTVVGAWAIIEFVFGLHLFEDFAVQMDTANWHLIQIRGSLARSEGAFGHSIAMGGFIALCVPFIITCKTSAAPKALMLAVATAGGILTFSRGAIIGIAVAVVLTLIFVPGETIGRRARAWLITVSIAASIVVVPFTLSVFDSVSSDLTVSTDYREDLAISFLPDLAPFGLGAGVEFADGRQFYRQFTSIDNAYALMGLQLGWVAVAILVAGLVGMGVRLVRRRGGPAEAALVAQAMVLFTVALITQFGLAVFFIAGVAVGFGAGKQPQRTAMATPAERFVKHRGGRHVRT